MSKNTEWAWVGRLRRSSRRAQCALSQKELPHVQGWKPSGDFGTAGWIVLPHPSKSNWLHDRLTCGRFSTGVLVFCGCLFTRAPVNFFCLLCAPVACSFVTEEQHSMAGTYGYHSLMTNTPELFPASRKVAMDKLGLLHQRLLWTFGYKSVWTCTFIYLK